MFKEKGLGMFFYLCYSISYLFGIDKDMMVELFMFVFRWVIEKEENFYGLFLLIC